MKSFRSSRLFQTLRNVYWQRPCVRPRSTILLAADWADKTFEAKDSYARRRGPWFRTRYEKEIHLLPSKDFLRGHFPPTVPSSFGEKLYLAREATNKRPVLNEEEVFECVRQKGYRILDGQTMSPIEQVNSIAEAKIVVSAMGASLTNIVFARQSKVLEILNKYRADVFCFYPLAQRCGHQYWWLPAEGIGAGLMDGITIKISDLERALDTIEAA